ncbi:MAG: sugar transferase [Oscillatoria sp. PMC 1068.18]|nr:sugar transferase [Oscillatoria sp. PMC 1076.18]MEC4988657.1 sugar transferase [Oscillatoria sp. PMC 1068.18]
MISQTPETDFPITFFEDTAVMELPNRIAVLEAVAFKKAFQYLLSLQDTLPEQIVLDCNKTTFIDSSGIGALVSNLKLAREKEIELILKHVHPPVMAVLAITGLDQALKIQSQVQNPTASSKRLSEKHLPTTHPSVRSWVKRSIDIVGSIIGLVITGVLFVPIAIAIEIDSPGPLFFGQIRCGWMGKRFKIWKFRSMCLDAEAMKAKVKNQASGAIFKNENDPRVTRVGRFLRRTSLDELPQFWNVLKGEMSLVGTRPPTPNEVDIYEVPEWQRLDVKPGMTGEWQVNGRSQVKNFEDVIKLDLRYQENWSLMYDFKLIAKTILILFQKNSGAY